MSTIASDVNVQAAALLTDPTQITFTHAVLLPYLRIAWRELEEALVANGIQDVEEKFTTAQTITANTTEWTGQPTDLLIPIELFERKVGGTVDDWELVKERQSDPFEVPQSKLENWWFAEGLIKFKGATENREVILRYQRELIVISSESTPLPVPGCISFLSFRTAGLIARVRGNKSRADDLDADASRHFDTLVGIKVKDEQATPVRPRRYAHGRRGFNSLLYRR